jgi:methylase of polypeptide subunit release factors
VLLAALPLSIPKYSRSVPIISCLFDNELFSVLNKAAGIPLDETGHGRRGAVPLNAWIQSNIRPSRHADALAVPRCVPLLEKQVGGLVVVSKTRQTDEILLQSPAYIAYACLVAGKAQEGINKQVLETSESATFPQGLSLMLFHTTNMEEDMRASLSKEGTPIVGTPEARLTEGGLMIALVSLCIPPALLELDSSCPTVFEIPIPKKLYKTLKREGLHAQRQKLAKGAAQGAREDVVVSFMGVPLKIGSKHLIPRSSSECLVSTALEELATIKIGTAASVLDLGCGCGALLLATLVGVSKPAYGVGVDLEEEALVHAERNAKLVLTSPQNGQARFLRLDFGRLCEPASRGALGHNDGFHVILCNPPYLPQKASAGRWTFEAKEALFAGSDGLDAYRVIAENVAKCQPPLLSEKGKLLLQLPASPKQQAFIKKIFEHQGFILSGAVRLDNRGLERCLVLQLQR